MVWGNVFWGNVFWRFLATKLVAGVGFEPTTFGLLARCPVDSRLEPSVRALNQLSPQNQQIIISLIHQLAQTEGINVALSPSTLATPSEGILLWIADLKSRGYSRRTIATYAQSARAYLAYDPTPTALSIKQCLAKRLEKVSPTRVNSERKALKSLYAYLVEAGLWDFDPTAKIRSIPIRHHERELPTREDIEKLLNAHTYRRCDEVKFKMMVVLLLDCGLRISEAASVRKGA